VTGQKAAKAMIVSNLFIARPFDATFGTHLKRRA